MFAFEMKQVFHKIVSLLMAFVVLFSTMSFTIDMHYCGDVLVDTAIFTTVESCGMEIPVTESDCSIVKKNCCSEKQIVFEGQNELEVSFDSFSLDQQLIVTSFIYTYLNLFEGLEENIIPFKEYTPPLVVKDIQLFDESFLI